MHEDFWAQWTTPGTVTYGGPDDFKCQLVPRMGPPDESGMVRIDAAGIYHARQFKGGILVPQAEFARKGVWEDYCGSKFYVWATQHRY